MQLLPFNSFLVSGFIDDAYVECPMCGCQHRLPLQTRFCIENHPDHEPHRNITILAEEHVPHLHRICERCGYEWLEKTAT